MAEIICKFCKQPIKANTSECPFCGLDQKTGVVTKPASGLPSQPQRAAKAGGRKNALLQLLFLALAITAVVFFAKYFLGKDLISEVTSRVKIAYARMFGSKKGPKKPGLKTTRKKSKKGDKGSEKIKMTEIMREYWERDELPPKAYQSFKVEGIFYDPGSKVSAIINGDLVFENDIVQGYTIEKINPDSVQIYNGSERKVLKAGESFPLPSAAKEQQ